MTNVKLLADKIQQSGLKKSYIADKIGVSKSTFYAQMQGKTEFRMSQVATISQLLGLDEANITAIFFARDGA